MIIQMVSLFLLAVFSSNIYAFSKSPFPDGEVGLKIIQNQICAYIDRLDLKGNYTVDIYYFDPKTQKAESSSYKNTFEKHYPLENRCILVNPKNFKNINLESRGDYSITLSALKDPSKEIDQYTNFIGFRTSFCIKNNKGQLKIQDYIQGQCIDKEPKAPKAQASTTDTGSKSWFERLLGWFKGL